MSYYQGDYYEGDYYQGDPFLGALIGMGASWLGKKLLGRGAKQLGKAAIARTGAGALVGSGTGMVIGAGIQPAYAAVKNIWERGAGFVAGRGPMNLTIQGQPSAAMGPGGLPCCPSGYHWNKSRSMAAASMGAAPGTICVRNRSMNIANPRALRRSLRRVTGFAKLAARSRTAIKKAARTV